MAIAIAEIKRRLKNISVYVSKDMVETVLVAYADELSAAGYGEKWKENVFLSSLKGHKKVLEMVSTGKTERNRNKITSLMSRRAKRLTGSFSWFQDKQQDEKTEQTGPVTGRRVRQNKEDQAWKREYETVMFIPITKVGELGKRLNMVEDHLRNTTRVKYVEWMGMALADSIVTKDPWGRLVCGRPKCLPCKTQPRLCLKPGALYSLNCTTCKEEGLDSL